MTDLKKGWIHESDKWTRDEILRCFQHSTPVNVLGDSETWIELSMRDEIVWIDNAIYDDEEYYIKRPYQVQKGSMSVLYLLGYYLEHEHGINTYYNSDGTKYFVPPHYPLSEFEVQGNVS